MGYWSIFSATSPRLNEKVKLPGRPVEYYLNFHKESDRLRYRGRRRIPMEVFYEKYFRGDVEFKHGDCLDNLEYRHDWASFSLSWGVFSHFLFGFVPELIVHSRSQGNSNSTSMNPFPAPLPAADLVRYVQLIRRQMRNR
jgi:cyclopropane-fatty-acyl-phospholipid synthase